MSRHFHRLAPTLALAAASLAVPVHAQVPPPLGDGPGGVRALAKIPNAGAVVKRLWAPRLADGVASHAVAAGGGSLWIAGRKAAGGNGNPAGCIAFRVDPANGAIAGQFALPASCSNATGAAWAGDGILWVAAGDRLVRVDTRASLAAGQCVDSGCTTFRLDNGLRADFLAVSAGMLWVGDAKARELRGFPLSMLQDRLVSSPKVARADAKRTLALPRGVRGAAFGPGGTLWVVVNGTTGTRLARLDANARETGSWSIPAGTGDFEFSESRSQLWLVSDAGATGGGSFFFPLVYSLDPSRLN